MQDRAWNRFQNQAPNRTRTMDQIQIQIQMYSLRRFSFSGVQDLHLQRPVTKGPGNATAGAGR